MADAKKCDICGGFYELPNLSQCIRYALFKRAVINTVYDLCPICQSKLNNFVESMKENHDGEREEV